MLFPIAIEAGSDHQAYGVQVPDLPGCFSAGDTLDEALVNAREAISLYLEELFASEGNAMPTVSTLQDLAQRPNLAGWTFAVVDVDLSRIEGKAERINITMPSNILRRVDAYIAGTKSSRSGFIAEAVMERMTSSLVQEQPSGVARNTAKNKSKAAKQAARSKARSR